jgi:acyl-CoA hydrolase
MTKIFAKTVKSSEVVLTELMIPAYANFGGKVHGGILLSLMDKVAYVCAAQYCHQYCVTVAVEGVAFLNPVEVGELVSFKASVNYVGKTTMIIRNRVEANNPRTGETKHTTSSDYTMAAKNEEGELVEVPALILEDEVQLRRFCEGKMIKAFSAEKRRLLKADLEDVPLHDRLQMCNDERCQIEFVSA